MKQRTVAILWLVAISIPLVSAAAYAMFFNTAAGITWESGSRPNASVEKVIYLHLELLAEGRRVIAQGAVLSEFSSYNEPPFAEVSYELVADAMPVRLPSGAVLALLLDTPDPDRRHLGSVFANSCALAPFGSKGSGEAWLADIRSFEGRCEIRPDLLPIALLFPSPQDPRAIYIDLREPDAAVKFISGHVSMTNLVPTEQIVAALPWLAETQVAIEPQNETEVPRHLVELYFTNDFFVRRRHR